MTKAMSYSLAYTWAKTMQIRNIRRLSGQLGQAAEWHRSRPGNQLHLQPPWPGKTPREQVPGAVMDGWTLSGITRFETGGG